MTKEKGIKIFVCKNCGTESGEVGIVQKEHHYYKMFLDTGQWKDFHGDEEAISQVYFCLDCGKILSDIKIA